MKGGKDIFLSNSSNVLEQYNNKMKGETLCVNVLITAIATAIARKPKTVSRLKLHLKMPKI